MTGVWGGRLRVLPAGIDEAQKRRNQTIQDEVLIKRLARVFPQACAIRLIDE